jgi:ActR/RegA family two-component response regulator
MEQACNASRTDPAVGMTLNLDPNRVVILLEDSHEQIAAVRRFLERQGLVLFAASDIETTEAMAECGARFFILDVKLGDEPERVKAGLNALEVLRAKYRDAVFVAVLTAVKQQHDSAIEKLGADISLDKSTDKESDLQQILSTWERWVERQPAREFFNVPEKGRESRHADNWSQVTDSLDVNLLFPSDALALQITGATENDLARVLRERRRIARALSQKPPKFDDLVREIGTRMREELRGALRELGERGRFEGGQYIELASGDRLSGDLVRFVFRLLPVTYGADSILEQLREELYSAANRGFSGEWGSAIIVNGKVVLFPRGKDSND